MEGWQDNQSWANSCWQDSSCKNHGGKGMCSGGWGTEGWGVHPSSPPLPTYPLRAPPPPPYPQQQLACGPRPRVRPTPAPYPRPDQLPGSSPASDLASMWGGRNATRLDSKVSQSCARRQTNTPELQVLTGGKAMTMAAAMLATRRLSREIPAVPNSGPNSTTRTTQWIPRGSPAWLPCACGTQAV